MHEHAFDDRFRDLFIVAHRVARRILLDPTAAEDVAAETLSRAFADWHRLADAPHLEAWVARVATNLSLNIVRRHPPRLDRPVPTSSDDQLAGHIDLTAALRQLPSRQREVLVLRHIVGYSEPEIADYLGLTLGTVKTHLRRGYAAMRAHLGAPLGERKLHG